MFIQRKNIKVEVKWMPSHVDIDTSKEKPDWVEPWHIRENNKADWLAGVAARHAQLHDKIAQPIFNRA